MTSHFHHYGEMIKFYRKQCRMTQQELADQWPSHKHPSEGVAVSYVQGVESGKYRISNITTLRTLCTLLQIPAGVIGLNTHDPFHPDLPLELEKTQPMEKFLELATYLLIRFEDAYRHSPLPVAARDAHTLQTLFAWLRTDYPPSLKDEQQFLTRYSQVQNVIGVIHLGYGRYENAYETFREMLATTTQLRDPTMQAHALLTVGTELGRMGDKHQAVAYLEAARDLTFSTGKEVATYVHAYLARAYAEAGDPIRSERAIKTALTLAPPTYGDGTQFVYHTRSGLLAEESNLYLQNNQPQKVLDLYAVMEQQADQDGNARVKTWLPYDSTRAYERLKDIEACVFYAREFFHRANSLQTPHPIHQAKIFIQRLHTTYHDVPSVRHLYEEIEY